MAGTLTKSDIKFTSAYFYLQDELDGDGIPTGGSLIFANVGYVVETNEGEDIVKDLQGRQLTGAAKTDIVNAFAKLKTFLIAEEGIV